MLNLNSLLLLAEQAEAACMVISQKHGTVKLLHVDQQFTLRETVGRLIHAEYLTTAGKAEKGSIQIPLTVYHQLLVICTRHEIDVGLAILDPHLDTISQAFPNATVYAAHMSDLVAPSEPVVIVAYDQFVHPETGLQMLKGFAAQGSLQYAEVEAWRYKQYRSLGAQDTQS